MQKVAHLKNDKPVRYETKMKNAGLSPNIHKIIIRH